MDYTQVVIAVPTPRGAISSDCVIDAAIRSVPPFQKLVKLLIKVTVSVMHIRQCHDITMTFHLSYSGGRIIGEINIMMSYVEHDTYNCFAVLRFRNLLCPYLIGAYYCT